MKDPLAISPREPPCGKAWRGRVSEAGADFALVLPIELAGSLSARAYRRCWFGDGNGGGAEDIIRPKGSHAYL
jgi:hypothetical protein